MSGRRGLRWRITICAGRALSVAKHQRKLIADLRVIGPKRGSKREDGCDRPPGDQAHEQGVFDQDTARFATPKTRYQPENRWRNRDRRAGKRAANSPGERSKARRKTPQGDRHPPRRRYKTVPRILHDFLQAFLHLGSPRYFALFTASPGSLRFLVPCVSCAPHFAGPAWNASDPGSPVSLDPVSRLPRADFREPDNLMGQAPLLCGIPCVQAAARQALQFPGKHDGIDQQLQEYYTFPDNAMLAGS